MCRLSFKEQQKAAAILNGLTDLESVSLVV